MNRTPSYRIQRRWYSFLRRQKLSDKIHDNKGKLHPSIILMMRALAERQVKHRPVTTTLTADEHAWIQRRIDSYLRFLYRDRVSISSANRIVMG